ncbi:MAG: hypothetical protein HFE63_06415 [Clostridiales bacterium]|nr:hypothetical protein [Clostridiales bacterium]
MNDSERSKYGELLKEMYRDIFIFVLIFAAAVAYIFWSSAHQWNEQQKRALEMEQQRKIQAQINRASIVGVYSWVNYWEIVDVNKRGVYEYREVEKLEPGVEYRVGKLRMYDVNLRAGYNQIMLNSDDEARYIDPIITFAYNGFVHFKTSLDMDGSWLNYGPTDKADKTETWEFWASEERSDDTLEGWGQGMTSVRVPVNGINGYEVNINDERVSEEMRTYNYYIDERFGDIYENVPEEYADRTRRVWISHLKVEAYSQDPRLKMTANKIPVVTFTLKFRSYGAWDLTEEEYQSLIFAVPAITEYEYAPVVTVELII